MPGKKKQQDIKETLDKISSGDYTAKDEEVAKYWLFKLNEHHKTQFTDDDLQSVSSEMWANIIQRKNETKKIYRLWPHIAVAASVIIAISFGGYSFLNKQKAHEIEKILMHIEPGSNKAILTLSNGKQIILNDARNGKLIQQGNAAITKTQNGQIVYQAADKDTANDIAYNTTSTPRGGEYHITLADGTNVWLNAASSITYPTIFSRKDRTVQITGEVYFEVAHNAAKPFHVKSNGQTIEVLGTHFNINAYDDEHIIKTSLLEGSVKIITGDHIALLQPGQQSEVSVAENATGIFKGIQNVDVDEAVAWKNGSFQFDNADIKTVMRQLSRWYDVTIQCGSNVSDVHYTGLVPRRSNILAVLKMLNETGGTDYKLEGKTIIITK